MQGERREAHLQESTALEEKSENGGLEDWWTGMHTVGEGGSG